MLIDLREGGGEQEERERGETLMWEKNIDWLPPVCTPTLDQIHNLGMCSDRELNLQPFGTQNNVPTN